MIWPSTKVNVWPGTPNLSIGPLAPVEPARTDGFLDYFFTADADPAWVAELMELDDQVGVEDRELVESVQRGIRSGAFERGRLMLPSEELIADFQRWVPPGWPDRLSTPVVWSDRHRLHEPGGEVWVGCPHAGHRGARAR